MEVRMDSTSGKVVGGIDPVLAEIHQRLQADPKKWLKTLEQTPGGLANLEQEIHRAFSQMAGGSSTNRPWRRSASTECVRH